MSSYFARLAALLQAPAASATQARATSVPQPLEQDIEIDAAAPAATASAPVSAAIGPSDRVQTQDSNVSALGPARSGLPEVPATLSDQAFTSLASDSNAAALRSESPAAQAMPVLPELVPLADGNVATSVQARQSTTASFADILSVADAQDSASQGFLPVADSQSSTEPCLTRTASDPAVRAAAVNQPRTTDKQVFVTSLEGTAPASSPDAVNRIQAASDSMAVHGKSIWQEAPIAQAGSFVAPMPAGADKASRHAEIRIGTIALEVRASPPPAGVAAPAPAAAPPSMTPQQFSPRRHHLRWN